MAFVLMKIFEERPRRFDRWMNILTLGRLQQIRDEIVTGVARQGSAVLEIGCGTGSLLVALAQQGTRVFGIDSAQSMIETAQRKLSQARLAQPGTVKKLHALQVEDEFEPGTFDQVVSVLAFSEMSDDEIDCLLPQCRQVLKPNGQLILVDEVEPEGFFRRQIYFIYRHISRLLTFLGLQAMELKNANLLVKILYFVIELPLMLLTFFVVPPVTHPLAEIELRIERAGFRLLRTKAFLGGVLKLVRAEVAA